MPEKDNQARSICFYCEIFHCYFFSISFFLIVYYRTACGKVSHYLSEMSRTNKMVNFLKNKDVQYFPLISLIKECSFY
jgi:hypothetical protein